MTPKKVVLLHDWLTGFRGGERVLEALCEMFPEAPIYTLIYKKGSASPIIENRKIISSFLSKIPGIENSYRKFLPLFPMAAQSLKIPDDVDLVISNHHCVIKSVKKPSGAKHLSYVLSPMRYMYDQFDVYFGPDAPFYQRWGGKLFRNYLTNFDLESNKNVDQMVGISRFVQERITKFYHMDSKIIYPFVDLADFHPRQENPPPKEDFFLVVSAFAPNKRIDLAIQAFNQLEYKLKIIGGGQQEEWLKSIAKPNIEFLGSLSRKEVIDHLFRARALIFPGIEDFGIVPLESLAAGTPVIALKKAGVLDTLNEKTAIFFEDENVDSLISAVKEFFLKPSLQVADMHARAEEFSKEKFKSEIVKAVDAL